MHKHDITGSSFGDSRPICKEDWHSRGRSCCCRCYLHVHRIGRCDVVARLPAVEGTRLPCYFISRKWFWQRRDKLIHGKGRFLINSKTNRPVSLRLATGITLRIYVKAISDETKESPPRHGNNGKLSQFPFVLFRLVISREQFAKQFTNRAQFIRILDYPFCHLIFLSRGILEKFKRFPEYHFLVAVVFPAEILFRFMSGNFVQEVWTELQRVGKNYYYWISFIWRIEIAVGFYKCRWSILIYFRWIFFETIGRK